MAGENVSKAAGKAVSAARVRLKLSRTDVARAVGASSSKTVARWDAGAVPQNRFRTKLVEVLQLDPQKMEQLWAVTLIPPADVEPDTSAQVGRPGKVEGDERMAFRRAVIAGIEHGHATSPVWVVASLAAAELVGEPFGVPEWALQVLGVQPPDAPRPPLHAMQDAE